MCNSAYCSNCRTNWAALATQQDDVNDEEYEFCPQCKTDSFLQPAKENEPLINCSITTDCRNNLAKVKLPTLKSYKPPLTKEQRKTLFEAKEAAQEARIDTYIANCELHGKEQAERIYLLTPLLAHYESDVKAVIVE